jgi:hypothetical protein
MIFLLDNTDRERKKSVHETEVIFVFITIYCENFSEKE